MFRVLGCIFFQHDLKLVVLAGILCLFACVTAKSILSRAREANGAAREWWLVAAGVVAGCGIWGTHFVAMLAYLPGFLVSYDPALTLLSVLIAITMCTVGFAIGLRPKQELLGGSIVGAAIGAMHFIGMAAVRAPAVAIWDPVYVVSSTAIGIGLMAVGTRITRHMENGWARYFAGGLVFTVAICSLHFTAMAAVTYRFNPSVAVRGAVIAPATLAIAVAASAILVVALGLVGALVDRHLAQRASAETSRLREYIAQLEQTREELGIALEDADAANQSKTEFLAAMSHELRTPLNAVIGFSEIIEREAMGPIGNPRYKQYISDIRASGKHLLALINDILDLNRLDSGVAGLNEEVFDIAETISESVRMMSPQSKAAGVLVRNDVSHPLPGVKADRRRIQQVLLNLLSNAVKFTPNNGRVTVSSGLADEGLTISVADTGIGIAPDDIPRAFERFGQIDSSLARRYEGAGLGLPLARDLVELHGGKLTLESTPEVGTTVHIMLPRQRLLEVASAAA